MGRYSTRLKEKKIAREVEAPKQKGKNNIDENVSDNDDDRGPNLKESLREVEMGITEFLHDRPGFAGVLKARYSDFQVNEIDLLGKVLHLDNLSVPKPAKSQKHSDEEVANVRKTVEAFVSAEQWERIEELADMPQKSKDLPKIEIDVTSLEKDQRTEIHKAIKSLYEGNLVSATAKPENTSNKAIEKVVKIMKRVGRGEDRWNHPGVFVHFLAYKEHIDTNELASKLAGRLSLRNNQVNYAGNKDRRAITVQKMSVKRREPAYIQNAAKFFRGIEVGNFEFSDTPLKLGDLSGNRFRIALRHITANEEDIVAILEHVRDNGFIHYYGLQRFGSNAEVPTHKVGVALLQGDYKTACELILKPRKSDLPYMHEIRKYWWDTRDAAGAAAKFRYDNKSVEKKLLTGLAAHHKNDYIGALKNIPRNLLMLYPHAFQSLIFNCIASRRIKEFGLQLMPGDLVFREDADKSSAEDTEEVENEMDDSIDEVLVESKFKRKVKALTQEDIDSQAYTISDVVLPLPGFDVTYPANVVGEWYEESLKSYQLSSEKMNSTVKEIAMGGSYRKLLMKPGDMKWDFRSYQHKDTQLILSDFDKIKGRELEENKGDLKALILEFSLPTSGYATMLLREILKMDTSAANQIDVEAQQLKICNWQEPEGAQTEKESRADKRKNVACIENNAEDNLADKKFKSDVNQEEKPDIVEDPTLPDNKNLELAIPRNADNGPTDTAIVDADEKAKVEAEGGEEKEKKEANTDLKAEKSVLKVEAAAHESKKKDDASCKNATVGKINDENEDAPQSASSDDFDKVNTIEENEDEFNSQATEKAKADIEAAGEAPEKVEPKAEIAVANLGAKVDEIEKADIEDAGEAQEEVEPKPEIAVANLGAKVDEIEKAESQEFDRTDVADDTGKDDTDEENPDNNVEETVGTKRKNSDIAPPAKILKKSD